MRRQTATFVIDSELIQQRVLRLELWPEGHDTTGQLHEGELAYSLDNCIAVKEIML